VKLKPTVVLNKQPTMIVINFFKRAEILEKPEASGTGLSWVVVKNNIRQHAVDIRRHVTNLQNETLTLCMLYIRRDHYKVPGQSAGISSFSQGIYSLLHK